MFDDSLGDSGPLHGSADSAPAVPRADAHPKHPRNNAACRDQVLVVDDDEFSVDMLKRVLQRRFDVTFTTRASQALDWIRQGRRFDAILCDLLMPEMTGMDLHAQLLPTAPGQVERMIFLTGGAFAKPVRTFLDRIDNPWLAKPFDLRQLMAMINTVRS